MFIGYFTERPYQDREAPWYKHVLGMLDLSLSNGGYKPDLAADLYHRFFDEKVAIEGYDFDGMMLNAHHATPFCMGGGVMNLEAAILARITQRLKIVLLGNVTPIWDDPLSLAEELAFIDVISRGRLVSGLVRGTGRESVAHNAQPPFNTERFVEGHDFILKAWTEPGPFRFEGDHFQYRYVNPWIKPYQKPYPQIWVPGILSRWTLDFAAQHRYPYVMLDSQLELTAKAFDLYRSLATEYGFTAGPEHLGYMLKVHVDETEELAYHTGRKLIEGPGNLFLDGSNGQANPWAQNLPGLNARKAEGMLPTAEYYQVRNSRGLTTRGRPVPDPYAEPAKTPEEHERRRLEIWDSVLTRKAAIVGTPETVVPKLRQVLELLRPGSIILWSGDGDMTHEETMRGLRLLGQEVLPALREIGKELELDSPWEVDPLTGERVAQPASVAG